MRSPTLPSPSNQTQSNFRDAFRNLCPPGLRRRGSLSWCVVLERFFCLNQKVHEPIRSRIIPGRNARTVCWALETRRERGERTFLKPSSRASTHDAASVIFDVER